MLAEPDNSKLTCVLADDSAVMRDVSRALLESVGWVEISAEAADGIEALELIVQLRPNIAMLDVRMPGYTGFGVAALVRELQIPMSIVVFSALASDEIVDEASALDVDYVSKLDGVPAVMAALERARCQHSRVSA